MRSWLTRKKTKTYNDLYVMYFSALLFSYIFMREDLLIIGISLTVVLLYWRFLFNRDFSNRRRGIKTEDNSSQWLEDKLSPLGILVKKSISMDYGDIDIYIPSKDMVIDVKAFSKIDARLRSEKLLRSMRKQMSFTGASVGIFWLPNMRGVGPIQIENGIFVIGGKNEILKQFPECANRNHKPVLFGKCPRCGSEMIEKVNRNNNQMFFGCSQYPKCKSAVYT